MRSPFRLWESTVFKKSHALPFALLSLWSLPVAAQSAPAPAASDQDDLEVPATPSTVPRASAEKLPPESRPPAPPAKAAPAPVNTELQAQLDELRARLAAVEASRVAPPSTPTAGQAEPAKEVVYQENSANSRPIPRGFRIGGYLHAQYESNQMSEDQLQQGGTPLNQDRFSVRRGRLRLDRGWEYANATLELDANTTRGVTVGIRRAEASVLYRGSNPESMPPLLMLTLGVTDLPFGFELAESPRERPFMERTLGSSALFPSEMDAGAKLSGAVSFLRYAVAVTNGEPLDTLPGRYPRDPNAAKDITGRIGVETNPLPAFSISGGTSFNQGKGFHAGTQATKPSFVWQDTNEDGNLTPNELQAVPGAAATPSQNFKRWAYALDLQLELKTQFGSSRLYAEGFVASNLDRAYVIADPVLGGSDVREAGYYVAVAQDVTRYGQVGFRYSYYDPNSDFADSRRGIQVPTSIAVRTLSPMVALRLQDHTRLSFEYDFITDNLAKNALGVPTDAKNNQLTLRLQVQL